jgi:hypothetical protein
MTNRLPNRIACTMQDGSTRLAESFERLKILRSLGVRSSRLVEIVPCEQDEQDSINSVMVLSDTYDDSDEAISDLVTGYHEQVQPRHGAFGAGAGFEQKWVKPLRYEGTASRAR